MIGPFVVKFEQLSLGEHEFTFKAGKMLFEGSGNEDVLDANFDIDLMLYKTGNMMELKFHYTGDFVLPCDRCNDPVEVSVEDETKLALKFGQVHHEDLDELIVLEDHEHEIDLKQYLYECISLMIPFRHVHEEENCNAEILKKLGRIKEDASSDTDPRWQKLKEL